MVSGALLKSSKLGFASIKCTRSLLPQCRTFSVQLTEAQSAVQDVVRRFAEEQLKPNAAKLDLEGRFPFGPIKKLTNMGLMGATPSGDYGGLCLDYLSLAIAIEELSRGCASTGMIVSIHNFLYVNLVYELGTCEQKEIFLKGFTNGGKIGCFALSEPGAGSDAASIRVTAKCDGTHWVLNGKKSWVTSAIEGSATVVFATFNREARHKGIACEYYLLVEHLYLSVGSHWVLNGKKSWVTSAIEGSATVVFATFNCEARHKGIACEYYLLVEHLYLSVGSHWVLNGKKSWVTSAIEGSGTVVFATFNPEARHKGIACFLVPLDAEGVFRGSKEPIMGVRAATACDLTLEEVRIPKSYMVGAPGEGFRIAMAQLDQGRIGIAAHAVGIAQAALDTAINYAKERQAFGKSLSRLPSVKDRLTDMCILVETARLLTYRAATQLCTKNSAMAKYVAGRNAAAVADHCVQILGGRGLSTKYAAERHYRDARGTQIYGGVTDIQKRLVGHFLLKENDAL